MSPFTIYDLVNMVICAGGIPVFADVNKSTLTIDLDCIKSVYDQDVAAIIITHTHLLNKDLEEIIIFCKKNNIVLIEDCAISFGTAFNNKFIGTFGDISFFSFGIFKFVSSLNGGMIMSNNTDIFKKIDQELLNFKKINYKLICKNYFKSLFISILTNSFIFKIFTSYLVKLGYQNNNKFINNFSKNDPNPKLLNYLPDNYKINITVDQSANILKQLGNYKYDLGKRIENAKIYYDNLKDIKNIHIPKFEKGISNGWINFPIQYKKRDKLLNYLFENNRDLAIYFYRNCNDLQIFSKYRDRNLKIIDEVVKEIIILPTYPKYGRVQIMRNIYLIKKYFNDNE